MNELIRIFDSKGKKAVSARELYSGLGFKDNNFTKFCSRYITKNEFAVQGVDYEHLVLLDDIPNGGTREMKDFALTIDFAKKVCMLAKTDAGEKIRNYFIEVEKAALTVMKSIEPEELLLRQAKMLVDQKKRIANVEERVTFLEAKLNTRPGHFTVRAYARIHGIDITTSTAMEIGKLAAGICRINNYEIGRCDDSRYGWVGTYPRRVLDKVFEAVIFN